MAAKRTKAKAASKTTQQKFRLVRRRIPITTITSPAIQAQQQRARRQALIRANALRRARQAQAGALRAFVKIGRSVRRQQLTYLRQRQALNAMRMTRQQTRGLARASSIRRMAARRLSAQAGRTNFASGALAGIQGWQTQSALNTLTLQRALAQTKTVTRAKNTSAVARSAQRVKAIRGNKLRRGRKRTAAQYAYVYVPVGGTRKAGQRQAVRGKSAKARQHKRTTLTHGQVKSRAKVKSRTGKKNAKLAKKPKAAFLERAVSTEWITAGNDTGTENCAAVAIANHLLFYTRLRMTDDQVAWLAEQGETIPELLEAWNCYELFTNIRPVKWRLYGTTRPGFIVVFETEHGTHAGVELEAGLVVSWGKLVLRETPVEEAWEITWRAASGAFGQL